MNAIKQNFANHLKAGLTRYYGGKLPSYNVIARDFTLRSPNLPPVSSETIRHWLIGDSLPHLSRMQVLTSWLGADLGCVSASESIVLCNKRQEGHASPPDQNTLCDMIERLSHHEREALISLVQMILAKHDCGGGVSITRYKL